MGRDLSAPARVACQLTILYCYATLPFWQVQRLLLLRKLLQLKHLRQQRQQEQQQQQHGKQRRGGQLGNCSGEVPGVMAAFGLRHLAAWPAAVPLLEAELCDEEFIVRARRELEREEGKTEDIREVHQPEEEGLEGLNLTWMASLKRAASRRNQATLGTEEWGRKKCSRMEWEAAGQEGRREPHRSWVQQSGEEGPVRSCGFHKRLYATYQGGRQMLRWAGEMRS